MVNTDIRGNSKMVNIYKHALRHFWHSPGIEPVTFWSQVEHATTIPRHPPWKASSLSDYATKTTAWAPVFRVRCSSGRTCIIFYLFHDIEPFWSTHVVDGGPVGGRLRTARPPVSRAQVMADQVGRRTQESAGARAYVCLWRCLTDRGVRISTRADSSPWHPRISTTIALQRRDVARSRRRRIYLLLANILAVVNWKFRKNTSLCYLLICVIYL